jgi:hypothetical protein
MKPFARACLATLLCLGGGATSCLAQAPQAKPEAPRAAAPAPGSGAALLQLDDGRSGRGNLIATTGIRGFSKPESPAAHALIMTIGDYQGGIPKLKGVPYDIATATEIARRMGVPAENIQTLKDGELTLDGMRQALDALEGKLGGSDQVFIYYSGHGGRQMIREDNGSERCAESLISVDGQGFTDAELEARLTRMSRKAQKTIVLLDACHSGGVTTRAGASAQALFTPKSWTPPNRDCVKPTNVLTRSPLASKVAGSGGANFVHIAAARENEVSLDQPGRGGVASQAWLACLAGAATDTDGSGGLSAEEIRTCAQERIDQQFRNVQGFLPHHVALTGNPAMILSYAAKEAPPPAAVAPAPTPVPSQAPALYPSLVAPRPAPLAALNDVYQSRDDRRLVTLTAEKSTLKIGRDSINFTLSSREGGHVYLLMVGSDGQTFDLLFPNAFDRNNVIEAGATLRLPRPSWQLGAEGPPGKDTLLAIVADNPRDFSAAGLKPSGPFSVVGAVAAKDIQLVTAGAEKPTAAECSDQSSLRNLAVSKRCSTAYGAALLTIEEVR